MVDDGGELCQRCMLTNDTTTMPNGQWLCEDCISGFGLLLCEVCMTFAPEVGFTWVTARRECLNCLRRTLSYREDEQRFYLRNNPDVAEYVTPREENGT
jgi:hypothetical protein